MIEHLNRKMNQENGKRSIKIAKKNEKREDDND